MGQIFLVGNPNVGKTAVLNILTNSQFTVGNWAGVTVSRQEGVLQLGSHSINILDLPGLYSLAPCSEDEEIAAREIFASPADLFINVIDVNNLHQNLMLSSELAELGVPMIGLLNFYDEFATTNEINLEALEQELGYKLIPFSARTGQGMDELKKLLAESQDYSRFMVEKRISSQEKYRGLEKAFETIMPRFMLAKLSPNIDKTAFLAQLSVGNTLIMGSLAVSSEMLEEIIETKIDLIPDFVQDLLDKKAVLVESANVQFKKGVKDPLWFTHMVDHVLMHPVWGLVSFAIIMTGLFSVVFNAANPFIDFIDWFIASKLGDYATVLLSDTPDVLQSFIINGLIGGVGGVLTFVPLVFILYFLLAFLEESGYLARIAVLLEAPLSKIGFSGKAFLPLMLGFGCNVPAIYGARVLETPQQRRLTALLAPLMSCGARLTVFALFAAAFFPTNGAIILTSLYFCGIVLAVILGWIFSRFPHFSSINTCFVMVLPPYRVPDAKIVFRTAWMHARSYIQKAGGLILGMLMLIWAFSYFPAQGDISGSYLAKLGRVIQPIFVPLGFGERWEPVVSIVPSLVAKEAVVGFLGQVLETAEEESEVPEIGTPLEEIQEIGGQFAEAVKTSVVDSVTFNVAQLFAPPDIEELEESGGSGVVQKLRELWENNPLAPLKAYSFMLFILLTLPCVASIAALKQELDPKTFRLSIALYLLMPYVISLLFYQGAKL
ncbi:MAG: ferrous iron transport protein B, partial [Brevinema sp.]